MLKNSPGRIGEIIRISVGYDAVDRTVPMHPRLQAALDKDVKANARFSGLSKSRQQEMIRYITRLKTDESIDSNITRLVAFLKGHGSFGGREAGT